MATPLPERRRLLGRDDDLRALHERIRSGARLLTITGPAGTGKSSVLAEIGHWHSLRAVFADLTHARDIADVCRAVGIALGVSLGGTDPVRAIGAALRRLGPTVLLLDNFEQVVPHARETVGVWHLAAPELCQVVASRIALRLGAEQRYALEPLTVPTADRLHDIQKSPSVQLFVDRAQQHDRHFTLTADNAPAIAGVVRELEGMPLAIELAAARIPLLPPQKLLARLDRQLKLLRSQRRDGPRRQATLERAIAWSWDLMAPADAEAMAALSVFEGGFTLPAAEAVIGSTASATLESLIDQSLVRASDGEGRFRVYSAVQAYAKQQAALSPQTHHTHRTLHARWVARAAADGLHIDDLANAVTAARRMVQRGESPHLAPTVLAAHGLLRLQGPISAAKALLDQAMAMPLPAGDRLQLLTARVAASQQLGARGPAFADLAEARTLAEELGQLPTLAVILRTAAVLHHDAKDMPRAEAAYQDALQLYQALEDPRGEAQILRNLGHLFRETGRHDEAHRSLESALQIALRQGDAVSESATRGAFGLLFLERGSLEEAEAALTGAARVCAENGDLAREAVHLSNLGLTLAEAQQYPEAHEALKRSIALHEQVGQRRLLALTYGYRGQVYLTEGRAHDARPLLETAIEICQELAVPEGEGTFRAGLAEVYAIQKQLPRARRELERAEALLTDAEVVSELLDLHLRRARIEWDHDPVAAHGALSLAEGLLSQLGLSWHARQAREARALRNRTDTPQSSQAPALTRLGPYHLTRRLGQGGMGTVWLADGPSGQVAIKVLHDHLALHRVLRARFAREARVGASLDTVGVVQTLDAGEDDGRHYIVMEYVNGPSLRSWVLDQGPLDSATTLSVATRLLEALGACHEAGILHRDVKPNNVLMAADGPKLSDLGIARMRDDSSGLTSTGQFVGSTRYAAPEQFHGGRTIDARADLYALGITLYEVCTGTAPFPKQPLPSLFLTKSTRSAPAPSALVPALSDTVDRLVCWLTAPHPEQRPESAFAALSALHEGRLPDTTPTEEHTAIGFLVEAHTET
ncbi:MAG: tetratricopeptide repeat protein [Proteobacteria bacterium]|nr:tetratricopeptide repeat protein [Pseudomonadota bacterium]